MAKTQLAIYNDIGNPIEAATAMGLQISASGMLGVKSPEAGTMVAFTCMAENITPLDFYRKYHIIDNKPSQRAWSMLAEFAEAEGCSYKLIENSPATARIEFTTPQQTVDAKFTWEEAQNSRWPWKNWKNHDEGLKDNWATAEDQENQLFSRLISKWCKRLKPELFHGTYVPEEIMDLELAPSGAVPGTATVVNEPDRVPTAAEVCGLQTPADEQTPPFDGTKPVATQQQSPPETVQATAAVVADASPIAEQALPERTDGLAYVSEKDALELDALFAFVIKADRMSPSGKQTSLEKMRCGRPGASQVDLLDDEQAQELLAKLRKLRRDIEGNDV